MTLKKSISVFASILFSQKKNLLLQNIGHTMVILIWIQQPSWANKPIAYHQQKTIRDSNKESS